MKRPDFVDIEEACRILNVDRQALYKCVTKGLLRSYRRPLERRVYYRRSEVEALLDCFVEKSKRRSAPIARDGTNAHRVVS